MMRSAVSPGGSSGSNTVVIPSIGLFGMRRRAPDGAFTGSAEAVFTGAVRAGAADAACSVLEAFDFWHDNAEMASQSAAIGAVAFIV
jgi:hypothetical protein